MSFKLKENGDTYIDLPFENVVDKPKRQMNVEEEKINKPKPISQLKSDRVHKLIEKQKAKRS